MNREEEIIKALIELKVMKEQLMQLFFEMEDTLTLEKDKKGGFEAAAYRSWKEFYPLVYKLQALLEE